MLSSRWPSRARRGDDGSVMVAVTIVFVVSILLAVAIQTVMSGQTSTRVDQNRTNAFQHANAGIDHALFRIDKQMTPAVAGGTYTPILSGTTLLGFRDTVVADGSTYEIEARKNPPGQNTYWRVRSVGTDPSGSQRSAIATVAATPLFVNGFFTLTEFRLTGNQGSPIAYRSSVCATPTAACEIRPVPAFLGTNSVFTGATETIRSFASPSEPTHWAGFNMYGKATQAAADNACAAGRCSAEGGKVVQHTDALQVAVPDVPAGVLPCPGGGNITGAVAPGDYLCTASQPVNFSGTTTVTGVGNGTGVVRIWMRASMSASTGAQINPNQPPWKFRVFQSPPTPPQEYWPGTVCDADIWALLYTPGLRIACSGSHQPEFWGAVFAQYHGGTGNHFAFHWDLDSALVEHNGKYVIENWRECPVGVSDC